MSKWTGSLQEFSPAMFVIPCFAANIFWGPTGRLMTKLEITRYVTLTTSIIWISEPFEEMIEWMIMILCNVELFTLVNIMGAALKKKTMSQIFSFSKKCFSFLIMQFTLSKCYKNALKEKVLGFLNFLISLGTVHYWVEVFFSWRNIRKNLKVFWPKSLKSGTFGFLFVNKRSMWNT